MSGPPPRPSVPPPQRPPAASTVSSPPLLINSSSLPKSSPSLASPSSYVSVSASTSALASVLASDLCVCTLYVAAAVPLFPVLAVIVIIRPPCNYFHCPCHFSFLVMGSVAYVHFLPEATERLIQQKKIGWKTLVPRTITTDLVRKVEVTGLLLVLVRMYPLRTGE